MNKNVGAEHDMFGFIDESEWARATTGREHYLPHEACHKHENLLIINFEF